MMDEPIASRATHFYSSRKLSAAVETCQEQGGAGRKPLGQGSGRYRKQVNYFVRPWWRVTQKSGMKNRNLEGMDRERPQVIRQGQLMCCTSFMWKQALGKDLNQTQTFLG